MDNILRNIQQNRKENKLEQINNLHPSLKFTVKIEIEKSIAFLDIKIIRSSANFLESTWYTKKTDTGLTMNFHSLASIKYKKSVI